MFAKYLPEFGWQPYVLTRDWPPGDPYRDTSQCIEGLPADSYIHREVLGTEFEEESISRRGLWGAWRAFFMPDLAHPPGVAERLEDVGFNCWPSVRFDAIFATAPALDTLRVGAHMGRKLGVPWIADLRDISEQEAGMNGSFRERFLRMRSEVRRNILLRSASLITVVSKTHKRIIGGKCDVPVEVIYNGYDDHLSSAHHAIKAKDKFRIVYIGRLLNLWYRDPTALLSGVDRLLLTGGMRRDEIEILFYGTEPDILEPVLREYSCRDVVRIIQRVAHQEVPAVLSQADVLLVLTNRGRQGVLTSKVFEYLPFRKPILCVPGDGGELDELIRENSVGESCETSERVASVLSEWYRRWKMGEELPDATEGRNIGRFSRRSQAQVLAGLLDKSISTARH
jgi:glycosyltransferase involved in cell wall biosynthesis